jgi:4,5-DOPA dioxygenase extradiol
VHNLSVMSWEGRFAPAYDWAVRFNDYIREAIAEDAPERVIDYPSRGPDAAMAVTDPDHFWPLLYVLGARAPGEPVRFVTDHFEHRSLSMLSVIVGGEVASVRAAA